MVRRVSLLSVVALAGCGGGASADRQIRTTFADYQNAFVKGDARKACGLLTPAAQRQAVKGGRDFGLKTCTAVLRRGHDSLSPPQLAEVRKATIRKVEIKGDTATVRLRTALAGQQNVTRLRRLGGDWRIDADL